MGISRGSLVSVLFVLGIVIILTVIYFYPVEEKETSPMGWRMIYGNSQNNCLSSYNTSGLTGRIIWSKNAENSIIGALVSGNGRIYLLSGRKIIALNGGDVLWKSSMNFSSNIPAIDEYGNIYATTMEGQILSLNENGKIRWIFHFQGFKEEASAPIIVWNGTVYILTNMGNLYMISYGGNLITKVNLGIKTSLPPAVSPSGEVYVGFNNWVYVLTTNGNVMRKIELKGEIIRMALYEDELYVTTVYTEASPYPVVKNITPYLFAIGYNGKLKWKINLNDVGAKWGIPAALGVDEDGVYVGIKPSALPSGEEKNKTQNHSFIMKFDKQGNLLWKKGFYLVINGIALSRDGFLYATFSRYSEMNDEHCKIYAINQNGKILWDLELASSIGVPVIGSYGLYVYGGNSLYVMG